MQAKTRGSGRGKAFVHYRRPLDCPRIADARCGDRPAQEQGILIALFRKQLQRLGGAAGAEQKVRSRREHPNIDNAISAQPGEEPRRFLVPSKRDRDIGKH
jgi:hypothetical protein